MTEQESILKSTGNNGIEMNKSILKDSRLLDGVSGVLDATVSEVDLARAADDGMRVVEIDLASNRPVRLT